MIHYQMIMAMDAPGLVRIGPKKVFVIKNGQTRLWVVGQWLGK